jgi:hypothetical protein
MNQIEASYQKSRLRVPSPRYDFKAPRMSSKNHRFTLGIEEEFPSPKTSQKSSLLSQARSTTTASMPANAPTFGHPIISGIGGTGFEQSIRLDPTNPDRVYTSAPGSASADTSWLAF